MFYARSVLLYEFGKLYVMFYASSENIIICLAEPFGILLIALLARTLSVLLVTTCAMLVVNGQG